MTDYRLRAGRIGIEAIPYIRGRFGNRPIPGRLTSGDITVCGQALSAT
jgi:hypothetical protein